MEHESERKVNDDSAIEFAASFQTHWQVGVGVGGRQWPRVNQQELQLQYFSEFCQAALVAIQKFLEMRCCLRKCFEKI